MNIIFEGKSYDSVDQLPPEARAKYDAAMSKLEDKDNNGVPDILDNALRMSTTFTTTTSKIIFQGKTYDSADQLPPEARAKYDEAMSKLQDNNNNGIPDVLENALKTAPIASTTQINFASPQKSGQPPASSNIGPIIVLSIIALILAVGVIILLILLLGRVPR